MSLKAMNHVWEHSRQKGSALLAMLAIADIADDNGDCYPGVRKLAQKCRMTERNMQKLISKCEADGELLVFPNVGLKTASGWTNLFRVVMKGVNDTTPLNSPGVSGGSPHEMSRRSPHEVSPVTPKSSVQPSDYPSDSDDDSIRFYHWGKSQGLKPSKQVPEKELQQALSGHMARLGAGCFKAVIERCQKRSGRSWDYYLNALDAEQPKPQGAPQQGDPLDYVSGEFARFINS